MTRFISRLSVLCILAGCGDTSRNTDTSRTVDTTHVVLPSPTVPAQPPTVSASPASGPSAWKVTPRGIGALEAGMSPTQASAILQFVSTSPRDSTWKDCGYVTFKGLPAGAHVMVEQGTIARVEVRDSTISTEEGARVGDTEARIKQLYGNRVEVQPHKYTSGGHYLVVRPLLPADSVFRLVFETNGKVVTAYRAGRRPPVEYVEGCS